MSCIGGGREEGMHRIVWQEIFVCGVVPLKGKRKEKKKSEPINTHHSYIAGFLLFTFLTHIPSASPIRFGCLLFIFLSFPSISLSLCLDLHGSEAVGGGG